jgi:hypothetical protein
MYLCGFIFILINIFINEISSAEFDDLFQILSACIPNERFTNINLVFNQSIDDQSLRGKHDIFHRNHSRFIGNYHRYFRQYSKWAFIFKFQRIIKFFLLNSILVRTCYFNFIYLFSDYEEDITTSKSLLNLVLDPSSLYEQQTNFENESWIFQLRLSPNTPEYEIIVSVRSYFDRLPNIAFRSRIYVLVQTDDVRLFEVYRKMSAVNLTVSLLCKLDGETSRVKFLNGYEIWARRKDLSGVHLDIVYLPDHPLISTVNKVEIMPFFII